MGDIATEEEKIAFVPRESETSVSGGAIVPIETKTVSPVETLKEKTVSPLVPIGEEDVSEEFEPQPITPSESPLLIGIGTGEGKIEKAPVPTEPILPSRPTKLHIKKAKIPLYPEVFLPIKRKIRKKKKKKKRKKRRKRDFFEGLLWGKNEFF